MKLRLLGLAFFLAALASAHHSLAATYLEKEVKLDGKLPTKMAWCSAGRSSGAVPANSARPASSATR
jgi:hypothetical protein